jgi:tetratricopeptide (TPR) repeat protein
MPRNICHTPLVIQPPADLLVNYPQLKILAAQLAIKYVHHELVTETDLKTVGQALWQTLAIDETFAQWRMQTGTQILPLVIQSADHLPWECLYHPDSEFLGKHQHFTLSRQLQQTNVARVPLRPGPLKVLLFTAQPDDLEPETQRLNTEDEHAQVLEALIPWIQEGWVELTVPDDGRFVTFKQLLKQQEFHLVFLSGHGHFYHQPHSGDPSYGVFWFENDSGTSEAVRDQELAAAFSGSHLQAVVLSACQSGKAASGHLAAGLANCLIHVGITHVIGMRESILDRAGILFARHFCDAIGRQERIDVALQQARQAITQPLQGITYRDSDTSGLTALSLGQWCLPMLLSRDPAQPLIDWDFHPQPSSPDHIRSSSLTGVKLPQQFIGQRRELRELVPKLYNGTIKRLLITGAGGQGKTALAGQLALRLQARGYQVHTYSARPENTWEEFIFNLLLSLDKFHSELYHTQAKLATTPAQEAQVILKILSQQTQGRLVLFFDNLESQQDPHTHALTDTRLLVWLDVIQKLGNSAPLVLMTSRWKLPEVPETEHHPLAPSNYGDFLRYLQQLPGFPHNRSRWRSLYDALGGNFQGLQFFISARQQMSSVAEETAFLVQLQQAQQETQNYMAIAKVVSYLAAEERELLQRLPVYTSPIIIDGIKIIASDLTTAPAQLLQRLVDLSLVDVEYALDIKLRQYRCSPLVVDWLQTTGTPPPALAWYQKAAQYQVYFFKNLRYTLDQALTVHQALQAAQWFKRADEFVLDYLLEYFDRVGLYRDMLETWLPPLRESDDLEIKWRALEWSGTACWSIGDYDIALDYLKQALTIRQQLGDKSGEGTTLNNLSQIFKARGDYDTAIDYLKQALLLQQKLGDKYGQGATLNNFSQIFQARGDYDTALNYLKQALSIQQQLGNKRGEGTTLNNLSQIFKTRGDYDTALDYLKQALSIQQQLGDLAGLCVTLFNLGDIYYFQKNEIPRGMSTWVNAYSIAKKIGYAKILTTLEKLAQQLGGKGLAFWEKWEQQMEEPE